MCRGVWRRGEGDNVCRSRGKTSIFLRLGVTRSDKGALPGMEEAASVSQVIRAAQGALGVCSKRREDTYSFRHIIAKGSVGLFFLRLSRTTPWSSTAGAVKRYLFSSLAAEIQAMSTSLAASLTASPPSWWKKSTTD